MAAKRRGSSCHDLRRRNKVFLERPATLAAFWPLLHSATAGAEGSSGSPPFRSGARTRREAAGSAGHSGTGAVCEHRAHAARVSNVQEHEGGEASGAAASRGAERREGTGGTGAAERRRGSREVAVAAGGRALSLSSYQRLLDLLPRPPSLPLRRAPGTRPALAPAGGGGAAPSLSAGGTGRRSGGRPGKRRDREGVRLRRG